MRSLAFLAAAAASLAAAMPGSAMMVAFKPPLQRATSAEAVIVGKVTAIEKDPVEVKNGPGAPATTYRVAVVKVENALLGAAGLTHVKVGFIPRDTPDAAPAQPGRPILLRRRPVVPELKEGEEWILFLSKHPTAGFLTMSPMSPPVAAKGEEATKVVGQLKKVAAVLADPMKGLKAEKPADRYFAAVVLLSKYRAYPETGGQVEQVATPAEESRLILKGLLDGDWANFSGDVPNGFQALSMLGLTAQEGWKYPMIKPGQKPGEVQKQAFTTWLNGPGKDYVVKRNVPKSK